MTVTVVINVNDTKFDKSKLATATAGQGQALHLVGKLAQRAVRQSLGDIVSADSDVTVTSVTVA